MADVMPFASSCTTSTPHSAARRGTFHTPHGAVETARLHAGRHAGHGQGRSTVDQVRDDRRPDGPGQHLSPRPAARARRSSRRWAACTASWAGTGRSSPTAAAFSSSAWPTDARSPRRASTFRSHIDGALLELIARAGDRHSGSSSAATWPWCSTTSSRLPNAPTRRSRDAMRPQRPLGRALPRRRARARDQALFAIVQGGLDAELRVECARQLAATRLSRLRRRRPERRRVAGRDVRARSTSSCPALPADRAALPDGRRPAAGPARSRSRRGIDLFDCVMPTRNGRNALAFTDAGPLRLRNAVHQRDRAAARSRLPLPGLPPQPRLPAAPVPGRRNARPDPGSRSTTSPTTSGCWPRPARRSPPTASPSSDAEKLRGWATVPRDSEPQVGDPRRSAKLADAASGRPCWLWRQDL